MARAADPEPQSEPCSAARAIVAGLGSATNRALLATGALMVPEALVR